MSLSQSVINRVRTIYTRWVYKDLAKFGLRYEDLLWDGDSKDIGTGLDRLSEAEKHTRTMRIRRAQDLDLKHVYLPEDIRPSQQETFKAYVSPLVDQARTARVERETYE